MPELILSDHAAEALRPVVRELVGDCVRYYRGDIDALCRMSHPDLKRAVLAYLADRHNRDILESTNARDL